MAHVSCPPRATVTRILQQKAVFHAESHSLSLSNTDASSNACPGTPSAWSASQLNLWVVDLVKDPVTRDL